MINPINSSDQNTNDAKHLLVAYILNLQWEAIFGLTAIDTMQTY